MNHHGTGNRDGAPAAANPRHRMVVTAPEVSGRRFLLWVVLPLSLLAAGLFLWLKPDRPLGGKSSLFDPPPFFLEKARGKP